MRGSSAYRLSVTPGSVLAGPWVRNELWRRARAVPSLDLRFAESKSLVDATTGASLVTFTRASSGTYVGSDGLIKTAATNEARFDHNPTTGESLGLLVEEQRVNSLPNNTAQGTAAGSPGFAPTGWIVTGDANSISRQIIGTGVEDGINYIDIKYSGTSTGAGSFSVIPSALNTIVAASGQSWTGSAFVKLQAGSLSNVTNTLMGANGRSTAGASIEASFNAFSPTSEPLGKQRRTVSITLANASSERISMTAFSGSYASGVTIDITLRIGLPQLEQGAFATSPILTSGTAVTRSADVASISGSNFSSWYRQDEGTAFVECAVAQPNSGGNQFVLRASDNGYNNSAAWNIQSSGFASLTTAAGGVFDGIASSVATLTASTPAKFAACYQVNNLAISLAGVAPVIDTSATIPTALTRADIGSDHVNSNRVKAGTIRRLTYWPQRLSNPTLQSITQ